MTKAFLVAAVILPMLMWGMAIALPMLLHAPTPPLEGTIAVVDPTGSIASTLRASLDPELLAAEHDKRVAELRAKLEENIPEAFRERAEQQLESLLEQPRVRLTIEAIDDPSRIDQVKAAVRNGRYVV